METVSDKLFPGAALADDQHRFIQRASRETCSSTSRKLLASPSRLSLYCAMMNFAIE